jgi:hypothetical protein
MAYIDNEMPINVEKEFLEHASVCSSCSKELKEFQSIKKLLGNLKNVKVSKEFDFRIATSVRREHAHLKNPLYSFKLFLKDNLSKIIFIPASVMVLLLAFYFFNNKPEGSFFNKEVISQIDSSQGSELVIDELSVEKINYVLDSVKPVEIENGIFLNGAGEFSDYSNKNKVTVVNF